MSRLLLAIMTLAASPAQLADLELEARWGFDADAAHPGSTVRAALEVKVPGKFHVQSNEPLDEDLIPTTLTVTPPPGLTVREVVFPEPVMFEVAGDPYAVFEQEFVITFDLEVAAGVAPGTYAIPATLAYQACDDMICLMPSSLSIEGTLKVVPVSAPIRRFERVVFDVEAAVAIARQPDGGTPDRSPTDCDVLAELEGFTVLGTAGGYMGTEKFLEFVDAAESGTVLGNLLEGKGPLVILLLVILGGVALNLTPCVLPIIPINIAIIGAGARSGSRARGFALGGTYGLAMAVVYGGLGLVVTLTASTFGAINSTIWFNVGIAALFVVLGLAMFDVIAIDFSKLQSKLDMSGSARRGTFPLAFGMGAISALLAGACVAPVVIQVIVYSGDQYAKGSTLALALPFFLGLGMALPWPFAGAGLSLLPKPGPWMVRVKQAMGVFILAFAAYYGYLGWTIFDSTRVDPEQVRTAVAAQLEEGWTASICQGLATARAEDKLVLIDMWATWCKACIAMEKTTFKDPDVVAHLEDYVKIKYQAEDLRASPHRQIIERFEGIGLPHFAILRPAPPAQAALPR